eukprot:scaffold462_cov195-Pinguiococcus_pyrenoidosus.AAC.3
MDVAHEGGTIQGSQLVLLLRSETFRTAVLVRAHEDDGRVLRRIQRVSDVGMQLELLQVRDLLGTRIPKDDEYRTRAQK